MKSKAKFENKEKITQENSTILNSIDSEVERFTSKQKLKFKI